MKKILFGLFLSNSLLCASAAAPVIPSGWWRALLYREDGYTIAFNFEVQYVNGKPGWHIRNAAERLAVNDISWDKDSLIARMPLFESEFHLHYEKDKTLKGFWTRATSTGQQVMSVTAIPHQSERFPGKVLLPKFDVTGRWAVTFVDNKIPEDAIAEFTQKGNHLTGTFLTTTGDYRYLEGSLKGDSLQLSTFDGSHAYYFVARIKDRVSIEGGLYCSGAKFKESWTAIKDPHVTLPDTASAVYLRKGEDRLHFSFADLDSNLVSINDQRFRNKVVIIQIMGSWCPNCMDETAFLSDYYLKNKNRGIEMIGLAYEYSTDFHRSQKSLRKFQKQFNVQYLMLITGIRVGDSLRTEKTLPELTPIRMFPTTIFIGRDGKVKKIDNHFNGPGTGAHYEEFKKEFNATVDELLSK